jgi:hypothetical protein
MRTRAGARSFAGMTKTSAHGTPHVTTADTDAAGAPGMTCDSGTIAWKALTS